jgi:hypothetical protein
MAICLSKVTKHFAALSLVYMSSSKMRFCIAQYVKIERNIYFKSWGIMTLAGLFLSKSHRTTKLDYLIRHVNEPYIVLFGKIVWYFIQRGPRVKRWGPTRHHDTQQNDIHQNDTQHKGLGNCDEFYFTFKFEVQMWVRIYQIFERDLIPIHHLLNKSNMNTNTSKFSD